MSTHKLPALSDGRTRYVSQQWLRDPNGVLLKKPAPKGVRTPNGMIWGHDLNDFFWIQRIPNVDILTIWSRTMIKELGENCDEKEFDHADVMQSPRQRHPWPILKLPKNVSDIVAGLGTGLLQYGVIDQGCDVHAQEGYSPRYREEPVEEPQDTNSIDEELRSLVQRVLGVEDDGCFVRNNPKNPLKGSHGRPYPLLWAPHVRQALTAMRARLPKGVPAISCTIQSSLLTVVELDEIGVQVLSALDDEALERLMEHPPAATSTPTVSVTSVESCHTTEHIFDGLSRGASDTNNSACEEDSTVTERSDGRASEGASESDLNASAAQCSDTDECIISCKASNASDAPGSGTLVEDAAPSDASSSTECLASAHEVDGPTVMDQVPARGRIPAESPFSSHEIPKLEEFLPIEYFPDFLHVHDPHSITIDDEDSYRYAPFENLEGKPRVYKRVLPKLARDVVVEQTAGESKVLTDAVAVPPRVAHLHLAQQNRMGVGHHSLVHKAPLTLPAPLTAHSRNGRVVVAAKSAFPVISARELLHKEAKIYDRFPKQLMQDWCGYNLVTPIKHPVPIGPVVPKFYGYYVPVETVDGEERLCDELDRDAPSPILLLEECGEPVEPSKFTLDERSECYSLMLRLHYAGFTQGSFYVRNILVQPGPLTAPPEERSHRIPSFRIIDFGRGEEWDDWIGERSDEKKVERKKLEWGNFICDEDRRAQRELQIKDWCY